MKIRSVLLLLLCVLSGNAVADNTPEIPYSDIPTTQTTFTDHNLWDAALPIPLAYETSPLWAAQIEPSAEYRALASSDALLVLVRVEQSRPSEATAAKHDSLDPTDDGVVVYVQPERKLPRAYRFSANAAGATADAVVATGPGSNPDWNGEWSAFATETSNGYVIELHIPWNTLGIVGDSFAIGLHVERQVGTGRFERQGSAAVDRRLACFECQFPAFEVALRRRGSDADGSIRWLPYAMVAGERALNPRTSAETSQVREAEIGLDVSATTASGDRLIATVNPDFSQVQEDAFVSTINKRFASTFAERRPFFTEQRGSFSTPMNLVYTRSIADPSFGMQYVQKTESGSRALMLVDDSTTSYYETSANGSQVVTLPVRSWNAIYRDTQAIGDSRSSSWGRFLSIREADGYRNVVLSGDVSWLPNDQHRVTAQLAGSYAGAEVPDANVWRSERGLASVLSHQYSRGAYSAATDISWYTQDFRADLSANLRAGTASASHGSALTWAWPESHAVSSVNVEGTASIFVDDSGHLIEQEQAINVGMTLRNEVNINVSSGAQRYLDAGKFIGGHLTNLHLRLPLNPAWTLSLTTTQGSQPDFVNSTDGQLKSYSIALALSGVDWIDGSVLLVRDDFDSDFPGARYRTEFGSARLNLHFGLKHHVALFLNTARYDDHLDTGLPQFEPDALARWQLVYTWEPSRFTRLIVGGTQLQRDGEGIRGFQPQREIAFAKLIYEL